jgi:hypothetical protein
MLKCPKKDEGKEEPRHKWPTRFEDTLETL